jgi:hypothetical protein
MAKKALKAERRKGGKVEPMTGTARARFVTGFGGYHRGIQYGN